MRATPQNRAESPLSGELYKSPPPTLARRAICLEMALQAAEAMIGRRGGSSLKDRAEFILAHSRRAGVDARRYELAWLVARKWGRNTDHVPIENENSAMIAGKRAIFLSGQRRVSTQIKTRDKNA